MISYCLFPTLKCEKKKKREIYYPRVNIFFMSTIFSASTFCLSHISTHRHSLNVNIVTLRVNIFYVNNFLRVNILFNVTLKRINIY